MQEIICLSSHSIILLIATGAMVGFLLALTGGGGSVICVPLLLYVVKIPDIHKVIGTSAMAVAISALFNLCAHARKGHVAWAKGLGVSSVAVLGALTGAALGKAIDGHYLLIPFALLMLVIASVMLRKNRTCTHPGAADVITFPPALVWSGVAGTGVMAGLLGIGGGFLVVPLLVWFFRLSLVSAIATSLMVVFAMGMATSVSYALAGKISVSLTVWLIVGGLPGGMLGVTFANRLKKNEKTINTLFSVMLLLMASYMILQGLIH
ncbi:sulfite exporter TauE/SafE family protein [Erwinia mallotivora]|nr:sulfite exporter TauE/SafE family protein [Erwinia mallotivora]